MAQVRSQKPIKYQATIAFLADGSISQDTLNSMMPIGRYYRGIQARAQSQGYKVQPFSLQDPDFSTEHFKKVLHNRGIQGIIFGPVRYEHVDTPITLNLESLSSAACGAYLGPMKSLHHASPENFDAVKRCVNRLQASGDSRIGFVALEETVARGNGRSLAAFLLYQNDIPARQRIPPLILPVWDKERFKSWYERYRPEGIISTLYPKLIPWFASNGIAIPDTVQLATYHKTPYIYPYVSGIDQKFEMVGAATVDLIVGQLYRNEKGIPTEPKSVVIAGEWFEGNTVRPLK